MVYQTARLLFPYYTTGKVEILNYFWRLTLLVINGSFDQIYDTKAQENVKLFYTILEEEMLYQCSTCSEQFDDGDWLREGSACTVCGEGIVLPLEDKVSPYPTEYTDGEIYLENS